MSLTIADILPNNEEEFYRMLMDNVSAKIRNGMPGIIQSFNSTEQVVTVQPAIREQVTNKDLTKSWVTLPILVDVPLVLPRAGGFTLTLPVQKGDECLLFFSDLCIDGWWANGGVQNQPDKRRHDLSDGFAILGTWSQPRVLSSYSTDSAQLRSDDGSTYISVKNGEIDIQASTVKINGINFSTHVHSDPQGGTTGGPQ